MDTIRTLDIPYLVGGIVDTPTGSAWATDGYATWRMAGVTYRSRKIRRAVIDRVIGDPPFLARATKDTRAAMGIVEYGTRALPGILTTARARTDAPGIVIGRMADAVIVRGQADDANYTVAFRVGDAYVSETYHALCYGRECSTGEHPFDPVIVRDRRNREMVAIIMTMDLERKYR